MSIGNAGFVRLTLGPALLLTLAPPFVMALHLVCARFDGSLAAFASADWQTILDALPRPTWRALAIVLGWIVLQAALLVGLPGGSHDGPVTPAGLRPRYRANGLAAWIVTHALLAIGWAAGLFRASDVYRELGAMLVVLNVLALAICALTYLHGRRRPSADAVVTGHRLFDFFQGVELHPTVLGIDVKQLVNCRISMMGWSALTLVMAAHQLETHGRLSTGAAVSAALIVLYLFKFFVWETGYFNSLDIMHDRFGYYLCWGVLVWVPGLYTLPSQYLADHPSDLHPALALALFALGVVALITNYAADAQRQRVRATAGNTTVWGRAPRTLVARYRTRDGAERESLLLVSGFWGLSRHFHYVPELTLALAWTLPAGTGAVAYAYVTFLAILLFDRAHRDEKRCSAKYGATWDEYRRLVPARIVPGVY